MTLPFVSLEDLSDALGEDVSTSDLAVIALDTACQVVRDELGNVVNMTTETVKLDGRAFYRLILPEPPVRAVTSVVLTAYNVADETVVATDYVLEGGTPFLDNCFLRRLSTYWPVGQGNIEVTYIHGWDITELPTRESHRTHDDSHFEIWGAREAAQTFASPLDHTLSRVDVFVHKEGTPPNPLTVGVYAVDTNGEPTGTALGTGTVAVGDAGTTEGDVESVDISPTVAITGGTTYALVLSTTAGDASNDWHWTFDNTTADYANGDKLTNPAGTWVLDSGDDFLFTEYGLAERVPSSIRQVALSLATRVFRSYGAAAATGAVTSERLGVYSYTVDSAAAVAAASAQLLDIERAALDPYKVVVFA